MFHRFSINVPIAKTQKFNDGETQPINDWVGMLVYVVNPDGNELIKSGGGDSGYQARANITMDAYMTWKDY